MGSFLPLLPRHLLRPTPNLPPAHFFPEWFAHLSGSAIFSSSHALGMTGASPQLIFTELPLSAPSLAVASSSIAAPLISTILFEVNERERCASAIGGDEDSGRLTKRDARPPFRPLLLPRCSPFGGRAPSRIHDLSLLLAQVTHLRRRRLSLLTSITRNTDPFHFP